MPSFFAAGAGMLMRTHVPGQFPKPDRQNCVQIWPEPREGKIYGSLMIKRGLKRRARKRELQINLEMKEVLEKLLSMSHCKYIFTSSMDPTKPLGP